MWSLLCKYPLHGVSIERPSFGSLVYIPIIVVERQSFAPIWRIEHRPGDVSALPPGSGADYDEGLNQPDTVQENSRGRQPKRSIRREL